MSLPGYHSVMRMAQDRPAFSNGSEGDAWMDRWCYRCVHEESCPLLEAAMLGKTPAQWTPVDPRSLGNQYSCAEFKEAR